MWSRIQSFAGEFILALIFSSVTAAILFLIAFVSGWGDMRWWHVAISSVAFGSVLALIPRLTAPN